VLDPAVGDPEQPDRDGRDIARATKSRAINAAAEGKTSEGCYGTTPQTNHVIASGAKQSRLLGKRQFRALRPAAWIASSLCSSQ
jgi:hypothetical protein